MSDRVEVPRLPLCDFVEEHEKGSPVPFADYDARTKFGPWANMCEMHYQKYGPGRLGTGFGQRLILKEGADND
jgi:hypothetical protein